MSNEQFKQTFKWIRWLVINSAFLWCLCIAVNGNVNAGRVVVFMVWINLLFSLLFLCAALVKTESSVRLIKATKRKAVPKEFDLAYDTAIIFTLVWFGWWTTAICWTFATVFQQMVMMQAEENYGQTKANE